MASELLTEMLRTADPALLAVFAEHPGGDADGTDGDGTAAPADGDAHHHGIGEAGALLSLGLSAREGWKRGRRYLAKRQERARPKPESTNGTTTPAASATPIASAAPTNALPPPASSAESSAAEFEELHHDAVLEYGRQQTARHFKVPAERLDAVYYEFAVEEPAWRIDFRDTAPVIYHVAIKSNGSIMRAVTFLRTRL
ncbi:hypothetical protein [Streptomyces sp. SBT349]|uniref:hypothetical protein n=1 Tax=Streptomyces sp. SBT349 TaxID=1580539 RepID=UPI00066D8A09|nr:hypothetical protein [Streptomyces sp. SBT349]